MVGEPDRHQIDRTAMDNNRALSLARHVSERIDQTSQGSPVNALTAMCCQLINPGLKRRTPDSKRLDSGRLGGRRKA